MDFSIYESRHGGLYKFEKLHQAFWREIKP